MKLIILVPVRLGGTESTETEGYIEVLGIDGQWGGVCDNGFDIHDAHVICKMLGYPTAIEALANGAADDLYGTAPSGSNCRRPKKPPSWPPANPQVSCKSGTNNQCPRCA